MNPTQNRSKRETRDGSIDRFHPLCQDIESATAEYPSGLRGTDCKSVIRGFESHLGLFFHRSQDENQSAGSPGGKQRSKIGTTHDAIAVEVILCSAPRRQQGGQIDAVHDAIIVQVSGNSPRTRARRRS